jgi:hypothetical protein
MNMASHLRENLCTEPGQHAHPSSFQIEKLKTQLGGGGARGVGAAAGARRRSSDEDDDDLVHSLKEQLAQLQKQNEELKKAVSSSIGCPLLRIPLASTAGGCSHVNGCAAKHSV